MVTQQEVEADVFLASVPAREPDSIFALLGDPELDFNCRPDACWYTISTPVQGSSGTFAGVRSPTNLPICGCF